MNMEYSHDLAGEKNCCLIIWRFVNKKSWGTHTILLFSLKKNTITIYFSFDREIKQFDTKYCTNI